MRSSVALSVSLHIADWRFDDQKWLMKKWDQDSSQHLRYSTRSHDSGPSFGWISRYSI